MREIKFRAWDKKKKDMCIVDRIDRDGLLFYTDDNWSDSKRGVWNSYNKKFINAILMQYTGLKDKNGKEIYEGDIVTSKILGSIDFGTGEAKYIIIKNIVQYDKKYARFKPLCNGIDQKDFTIIGNMYENSELY